MTTVTYEEFLKELLALGASARGAEDWFDLATIGITEKDTAKSLAKIFYEDELGNQGDGPWGFGRGNAEDI